MATPTAALGLGAASPAARNFVWLAGDKTIATLLGVLVFGLIARRYGPEGSGHYAYALTLMQVALGMSMVCSTACILPRVTRMHRGIGGALANVFAVRMMGSLLSMAAVASYAVAVIGDTKRLIVALMMLAVVPLIEPFFVAPLYWQSRNANRVPVLNRGAGLSVRAMMVGIAVALDAPLWVPALAWVIEAIVVARLHSMSLRSLGQWRELAAQVTAWRASRYFRYGVRFLAGVALSQLFFRIDRLVLAQMLPAHDFGIYGTAM
ncbi:MAG TPA: hypothetical protein VFR86_00995, partial [Burkholderiaceae bacterium]|nr:hypothetical protein [Burkholderiaceae bacterium]